LTEQTGPANIPQLLPGSIGPFSLLTDPLMKSKMVQFLPEFGGSYLSRDDEYRHYVEDVALHFEQAGMSRTVGRIFGWLLISDPPHQTMNDLVDGLQVSKSSVSTAARYLLQIGLVQRFSLPGERRDYYRVTEGVWQSNMRQQKNQVVGFRKLAEQGLAILADQSPDRRSRLQEMRDFYAFFEKEFPLLLERWEMERKGD